MKKIVLSTLVMFCMAIGTINIANAEQRIAVIDMQKIIDNSAQIQDLNKEQETKIKELEKWVEMVKQDVEKQKTPEGKEKLFKQYRDSYFKKKDDIIKSGQTKMQGIMDNLSKTIDAQAKAKGYDMIITKGIVVYGGEDITEDVQKAFYSSYNNGSKPATKKQQIKAKK